MLPELVPAAVPALLTTATPAADAPPQALSPPSWQPQKAGLLPAEVAEYHLLRLQAEALETEAAALAALLAEAPEK